MKANVDLKNIPAQYECCLGRGCDKAETCLHHLWLGQMPGSQRMANLLNPAYMATLDLERCPYYRSSVPVRLVSGMMGMMAEMPSGKMAQFRLRAKALMPQRRYLAFRRGELLATPQEESAIRALLVEMFGEGHPYEFDRCEETMLW